MMDNQEVVEAEEIIEQEVEIPAETDENAPPSGELERDVEAESEARKYGWRPKGDFDKDPAGWVDAKRFLELPSTQKKMVQDELRRVKSETEQRMERLERANRKAIELALQSQRAAHEKELAQLRMAQRRAVEEGDTERYDALERREQDLLKAPPKIEIEDDAPSGPDPYVVQYMATPEGAWLNDPILREHGRAAIDASNGAAGNTPQQQIAYAEAQVRKYFPHMFEAQSKPRTAKVDGGGLGGGRSSSAAAKLPPEALRSGRDFVAQGLFKSLDEYAKAYFEQEA